MNILEFKYAYASVLKAFVDSPEEQWLTEAADLGREMVRTGVSPEEIAEIHDEAIQRLVEESSDKTLLKFVQHISAPLMEMLMAYGLAYREQEDEREWTKEALRESEGKLSAMLRSLGDHVSMMDDNLNILWANDVAKGLFGNDIIGKKCYEVYHGRDKPCEPFPCLTMKAFEDGQIHEHETQVQTHAGNTLDYACTASVALRDDEGRPAAVIEISRDITEHKRAEEALRESEKRYKEAQSLAHIGHWDYEPHEDNLFWSDELYSIFEIDKDAGALSIEDFLERVHPEDRDTIREQVESGESYRSDYRIVMDNGSVKHINENVLIVRQVDGKIVLMRGAAQDITERKKAERELQGRMNELETFYRATLGREGRVIELKQEVNELLELLGKNKKYMDYGK